LVGIVLTELFPGGSELLAVTAPGSVELGEDILGVVKDNLVKLASDQGEDGAIVRLGDGVRLEHGLELASEERLDERGNGRGGDFGGLVMGVLERVGHVVDNKRGPLGLEEVEGLGVLSKLDGVDPNKVDLALELLRDGSNFSDFGVLARVGGVEEEVGKRKTRLGVGGVVLAANLIKERNGVLLDEGGDGLGGGGLGIGKLITALIKRLKPS
jgi:hypothetical protein